MSQAKIVSLDSVKTGRKSEPSLPPIVQSVRMHVKRPLNELLQSLFDNTDDALFEMADRSRSDADQHMYFESMRQLRLHRKQIAAKFTEALGLGFDRVFQGNLQQAPEGDFDAIVDSITLVQNDELEVSVAIAGIVSKVTSQFSLAVMQLTKRIDFLCKDRDVTERMNPLGPEQLSSAFAYAIEHLNVDIKVRIILLKLFERFVMERMGPVYQAANQLLADAGILPDLKNTLRQARAGSTATRSSPSTADTRIGPSMPPAANGYRASAQDGAILPGYDSGPSLSGPLPQDFSVIQGLLRGARGGMPVHNPDPGSVISSQELIKALSQAQSEMDNTFISLESVPPLLDLHQVVTTRAAGLRGESGVSIGQADDDAVNLVGMLFDYILNDRNLAIPMKALIGRLQIPIVKLAVMDKTFFEKSNHPARQLLNELSSAGIGWSSAHELKRDSLYNKIESIVLRVMNGSADDPAGFKSLVVELRGFMRKDKQKNDLVEQRVKETEAGKAKTLKAKQAVQQLINQKASGMRLPPSVGRFVSDTWSRVLIYACVMQGDSSAQWQTHVQTLDDLLWSLQPLNNMRDIDRRDALTADVLQRLDAGMQEIRMEDTGIKDILAEVGKQLQEISRNDRCYLQDDNAPEPDANFEAMEEIVLTAPSEDADNTASAPPEPEFLRKIEQLSAGMWVELNQDNDVKLRCKLATIVEPGARYIFVNRRGMKVAEKTRVRLAADLKNNALTILDESQVFDRALQAVIGNLRLMHRNPVNA